MMGDKRRGKPQAECHAAHRLKRRPGPEQPGPTAAQQPHLLRHIGLAAATYQVPASACTGRSSINETHAVGIC